MQHGGTLALAISPRAGSGELPEKPPVPTPELLEELSRQIAKAYAGLSALDSLMNGVADFSPRTYHPSDPVLIRAWAQHQIRAASASLKIDIRL